MQYIIGGIVNSGFGKELKGDFFIAKANVNYAVDLRPVCCKKFEK